jgi:hypothetical protein
MLEQWQDPWQLSEHFGPSLRKGFHGASEFASCVSTLRVARFGSVLYESTSSSKLRRRKR